MTKIDANHILVSHGPDTLRACIDAALVPDGRDDALIDSEDSAHEDVADAPELHLETISLGAFASLELPPRGCVLSPIIPERGLAMVFAARGIGKTHFALGLTFAVSC